MKRILYVVMLGFLTITSTLNAKDTQKERELAEKLKKMQQEVNELSDDQKRMEKQIEGFFILLTKLEERVSILEKKVLGKSDENVNPYASIGMMHVCYRLSKDSRAKEKGALNDKDAFDRRFRTTKEIDEREYKDVHEIS